MLVKMQTLFSNYPEINLELLWISEWMGERTFMDARDVSALALRIQEFKKENARLKAILDKNGIEYESLESKTYNSNRIEAASVSICQFSLQEKSFYISKCIPRS